MVLRTFSIILLCYLTTLGCASPTKPIPRDIASLNANGGMVGIWFLQGSSSTHGPYNGELELRTAGDGTYDVTRVITYINYFYDGLKVQEVWQGKAVPTDDTLTVSYDLKQGEFITKVGNIQKTIKELQTPLTVAMRFLPTTAGLEAKFNNKRDSEYSEWMTTKRNLEDQPLWADRRLVIPENAPALSTAEKKKIQNAQRILNYNKDPFVQSYRNRPDFKNNRNSFIQDRTDIEFYKAEPNILRIVNKVTDDATIAEAVAKRNAFYPSLAEKAHRYDESTPQKHFSPASLIVVRKGPSEPQFSIDSLDTDAVFMTGFYAAAQAMRYQATKSNEALKNIQRALQGLRLAAEISANDANIASGLAPLPANKEIPAKWKAGEGAQAGWMWNADNQEQAYLGLLHGLSWVALHVPEAQGEIRQQLKVIVEVLMKKDSRLMSSVNRGTLHGLSAMLFRDANSKEIFASAKPPTLGTYAAGTADWEKEFSSLVQAAQNLQLAKVLDLPQKEYEWKSFLNSEFNVFQSARRPLRILMTQYLLPTTSAERTQLIAWARQVLEEVPYPRVQYALTIDHSGDARWTLSGTPRGYSTVTEKNRQPVQAYYQGLAQLPLYELLGYTSRFLWKEDAFQYQTTSLGQTEATGTDYLYAYWLGRLSGAVNIP